MLRREYSAYPLDLRDGVKVILLSGWLLVRGSNTEPLIRVIAEGTNEATAREILAEVLERVQACIDS
jgi:phosphomannomutase